MIEKCLDGCVVVWLVRSGLITLKRITVPWHYNVIVSVYVGNVIVSVTVVVIVPDVDVIDDVINLQIGRKCGEVEYQRSLFVSIGFSPRNIYDTQEWEY